jgi:hypothetical protein
MSGEALGYTPTGPQLGTLQMVLPYLHEKSRRRILRNSAADGCINADHVVDVSLFGCDFGLAKIRILILMVGTPRQWLPKPTSRQKLHQSPVDVF